MFRYYDFSDGPKILNENSLNTNSSSFLYILQYKSLPRILVIIPPTPEIMLGVLLNIGFILVVNVYRT